MLHKNAYSMQTCTSEVYMKSSARTFSLVSCMAILLAAAPFANADPIPYPNPGTVAPTPTLTATATGNITGYFFSYSASDNDSIELVDPD